MNKEEKIQDAYGEYWEEVKDYVNENGFIDYGLKGWNEATGTSNMSVSDMHRICRGYENMQSVNEKGYPWKQTCRPKSLQGIEDNNGWIKIESEDDLPKEGNIFWVMKIGYRYPIIETLYNNDAKYWIDTFTHYQPIIKPEPPIY